MSYRLMANPTPAQLAPFGAILERAFNATPAAWALFRGWAGDENFRLLLNEDAVVGGMVAYPMGHWFGGNALRCAGLAAVAVDPPARSQGVGAVLMTEALRALKAEGYPLSSLFAATQPFYRRVGFEQAGTCCTHGVPLASLGVADHTLPVERLESPQVEVLEPSYTLFARARAGLARRDKALWSRALRTDKGALHLYLAGPPGRPEGYVSFDQVGRDDGRYDLQVRDLVYTTPAACRRLLTLLADHRSIARELRWTGPLHDPLLHLLPEQDSRLAVQERWLLRILDAPAALAARGYPAGLEARLTVALHDPLFPENDGPWTLHVADGHGRVEPGGKPDLVMGINPLAALFSGYLHPRALEALGLIHGAEAGLATAELIFAGPEPWLMDRF